MKKYLQFLNLILRNGRWRSSGPDFNRNRAQTLEPLQEFIPQQARANVEVKATYLRAQAAYIASAFRLKGGHLRYDNLGYIRIPKAANTSLSYAMLLKQYPALENLALDETQVNALTDVNLKRLDEAGPESFFTVVRNPFARLVSVYRDFFEGGRSGKQDFMYADYLFGMLKADISFAEFVHRISTIPDRLKDQHFKPQHLFIEPYEKRGFAVQVFQLEKAEPLTQFLNNHGMQLGHRNRSRESYDYRHYYTPALLQQVYAIYRTDVERYGYLLPEV